MVSASAEGQHVFQSLSILLPSTCLHLDEIHRVDSLVRAGVS
jgi:hypothetical protein